MGGPRASMTLLAQLFPQQGSCRTFPPSLLSSLASPTPHGYTASLDHRSLLEMGRKEVLARCFGLCWCTRSGLWLPQSSHQCSGSLTLSWLCQGFSCYTSFLQFCEGSSCGPAYGCSA